MRYIHWIYFGSNVISFPVGTDNSLYYVALKDHFFEYIYYYHTKPVGIPLSDYLSLIIFGSFSKGHFLIVSLLDSAAPAFILSVLLRLKLPRLYSLLIVSTWSLGLISWEYWRWDGHYDHFNVFLFSLYGWAFYNSYKSSKMSKNLIFGISSGLLILFNSFAPFIVVFTLLSWGPRLMFREKRLLMARSLIPLMVFLIAGGKNYIQFGVPTTSTISGQAMMQFVAIELDHHTKSNFNKQNLFEEFVLQNEYPEWWLWCFNSGVEQGDPEMMQFVEKKTNLPLVKEAFEGAKEAGIDTFAYFIIGYIYETEETMQKTIDLAIDLDPRYVMFTRAVPLPETPLMHQSVKEGFVSADYWNRYTLGEDMDPIQPLVPDADKWVKKAYRSFYLRLSKIVDQLFRIRSLSDLAKNIDGFIGVAGFKMRDDAFTVLKESPKSNGDSV